MLIGYVVCTAALTTRHPCLLRVLVAIEARLVISMFTVSSDWLCEFRGCLCRQLSEFLSSLTITCYIGLLLLISNDILVITDVIDAELLTAHLVFLIVLLLTLTVGVAVDSSSVVMGFIPMLVIILVI